MTTIEQTTHAPARCLLSRATLCGATGARCGDDLGVTCGECREMRLGVRRG